MNFSLNLTDLFIQKKHRYFAYIFCILIFLAVIPNVFAQKITTSKSQDKIFNTFKPQKENTQSNYYQKPKSTTEYGINAGLSHLFGDVNSNSGYCFGLHMRKAINYSLSLRIDVQLSTISGLGTQLWQTLDKNGGLIEPVYDVYSVEKSWFPNYKVSQANLGASTVFNLGNILFKKHKPKWSLYTNFGIGLSSNETKLNLKNEKDLPYVGLQSITGDTESIQGRKLIRSQINDIYDLTFESNGPKKKGIFRIGDETNIHPYFNTGIGISRRISQRINIGFEGQIYFSDNDYLDGLHFRTSLDQTKNKDKILNTLVRIGINIGQFRRKSEPLYWLNPMDTIISDLTNFLKVPELEIVDTDNDGVIDLIDNQLNSPTGAPVDMHGVAKDSDRDGILDYMDHEPFSPYGELVDINGVVQKKCCLDTLTINGVISMKLKNHSHQKKSNKAWYLPIVQFKKQATDVPVDQLNNLKYIADVMLLDTNINVSIKAFSENSENELLVTKLRYINIIEYLKNQYNIEKDRFTFTLVNNDNSQENSGLKNTLEFIVD